MEATTIATPPAGVIYERNDKGKYETPPPPLVKATRNPLKWARNKAQLLLSAVILAHVGTYIVVALYYLLFEVNPTMTSLWHNAISNSVIRHDIRDVAEGLLGGLLAQQVIWNHYKRRRLNKSRLDELEIKLRIPNLKDDRKFSVGQLVASPFFVLLYAIPGFLVGMGLTALVHSLTNHAHHVVATANSLHPTHAGAKALSLWDRTKQGETGNFGEKIMGFGASLFFGRRPAKAVFDDLQLWFAEKRAAHGRPVKWYHPPTFAARVNDLESRGVTQAGSNAHSRAFSFIVMLGLVVGTGLAGFGLYVLTFVAN